MIQIVTQPPKRRGGATKQESRDVDIDLGILCAIAAPGVPMSQREIAACVGISQQAVGKIERRALRKLRRAISAVKRENRELFSHV